MRLARALGAALLLVLASISNAKAIPTLTGDVAVGIFSSGGEITVTAFDLAGVTSDPIGAAFLSLEASFDTVSQISTGGTIIVNDASFGEFLTGTLTTFNGNLQDPANASILSFTFLPTGGSAAGSYGPTFTVDIAGTFLPDDFGTGSLTVSVITAVPEPQALLFVLLGLVAIALLRHRRPLIVSA